MKKTAWYSGDVKPVRAGRYERKYDFSAQEDSFDFFDGRDWFLIFNDGSVSSGRAQTQDRPWRGLTKEAK